MIGRDLARYGDRAGALRALAGLLGAAPPRNDRFSTVIGPSSNSAPCLLFDDEFVAVAGGVDRVRAQVVAACARS